ncbi:putative 2OG-Fe(II) oxygenase [Cyanobium sp. CH-040]|uniref:putative 2OG-Fe(II) oxygenase n=1 Tax=Cyanobium sp. CH-040 TaxID=2823708 RepID=UPI0020CE700E|nr:putative 2OG-Fe(II) oxygenase [Cyanobium sp. CH-040]MCP9928344.1 hypothetical protein [Cyanobium sp. CH-040]
MQIASLFPIPVGSFQLGRPLTTAELACVNGLPTRANEGNKTSRNSRVLDEPDLNAVKNFIEASLQSFLGHVYNPSSPCGIRITQSWCNYAERGGFHLRHSHANSFLSGVFYFMADPERDSIRFFRHDHQAYKFPPKQWNHWIAESCWFAVSPGDLLIFPSSLAHRVDPIPDERMRLSLAFNTFPTGELGDEGDLTLLRLGEP